VRLWEHSLELKIISVRSARKKDKFDLALCVKACLSKGKLALEEEDILVISSKFAAMAEGHFINLDTIEQISKRAKVLSKKYQIDLKLSELIVRESRAILGGIQGFALAATKSGVLAPNAGIDRSNVPEGCAILYPVDPEKTCHRLWKELTRSQDKRRGRKLRHLGVILSDSRVMPGRIGTTGVAIAASGFETVVDFRGKKDLFGNVLKVTLRAVADQIASAAELMMGEADEAIPIVLVRGWKGKFYDSPETGSLGMEIPFEKDLYIQSLRDAFNVR
jgi:coenzyme F420-0:L-glutamate ligase / coenzyme F420-1:gamma-L-glutamate ligase